MNHSICVLIPAYNEETTIGATLQSVIKIKDSADVFVVVDGSSDATYEVAKKYTQNVLNLGENSGKATAINRAVEYFNLSKKYHYITLIDGDTKMDPCFFKEMVTIINADEKKELISIVGKVLGRQHNWLTLYRLWEYELSQSVHKQAQNTIGAIVVCSGCASVYRSDILSTHPIPTTTVTEDMDYTFLLHRKKLGKIVYTDRAIVVTQDPRTLPDYMKQIYRWYTGFWQSLVKHAIPWGGQPLDFEVAMLALEGLFNSLLIILFLFIVPYALFTRSYWLIVYPFIVDFVIFFLPTLLYTAIKHKTAQLLLYIPLYYGIRFACSICFLLCFVQLLIAPSRQLVWSKVSRYNVT